MAGSKKAKKPTDQSRSPYRQPIRGQTHKNVTVCGHLVDFKMNLICSLPPRHFGDLHACLASDLEGNMFMVYKRDGEEESQICQVHISQRVDE